MNNIWIGILICCGVAYFLGAIPYIVNCACNEGFLCETYRDVTTKVGFIIFLMLDIIMLPWTLACCLVGGIVLLFEKIIFKKE